MFSYNEFSKALLQTLFRSKKPSLNTKELRDWCEDVAESWVKVQTTILAALLQWRLRARLVQKKKKAAE